MPTKPAVKKNSISKMLQHDVLDLETMGQAPGCPIIAIGAVPVSAAGAYPEAGFYQVIDLQSCLDVGLRMDASTVLWWLQQSDAARAEFKRPGIPLREALKNYTEHLGATYPRSRSGKSDAKVWGNGSDFDNAILAYAYHACGLELPWEFWANRCFRTMHAAYPSVMYVKPIQAHNALADATAQAEHLVKLCQAGMTLA